MNLTNKIMRKAEVNKLEAEQLNLIYKYESLNDKVNNKIFVSYLMLSVAIIFKFNDYILILISLYILYLLIKKYFDKKLLINNIKKLSK